MRAADLVTASILALLGGLVIFDALCLGVGWGSDGPKSGFFPFWLALILVLACVLIAAQATIKRSKTLFVEGDKLRLVLKVLWPAAAAVALMQWIGLYVASVIYMAFYMRWVGRHSWSMVAILAVGLPVMFFLVFEKWFLVPMPKGPLEAWLGY